VELTKMKATVALPDATPLNMGVEYSDEQMATAISNFITRMQWGRVTGNGKDRMVICERGVDLLGRTIYQPAEKRVGLAKLTERVKQVLTDRGVAEVRQEEPEAKALKAAPEDKALKEPEGHKGHRA